jgi:hypothetical protein
VEGGFGGRHRETVVLSLSAVYAGVAMLMRLRGFEALLKILKEIVRILDSCENRAHKLLKY